MSWFQSVEHSDLFFTQLLVGRYRNWGSFNWDHFIIFCSVIGGVVYIYLIALNAIAKTYNEALEKIPMSMLPLDQKSLSHGLFREIEAESQRVEDFKRNRRIRPEHNPMSVAPALARGDDAWGQLDTADALHYATAIARSPALLEKTALSRRPGLHAKDSRSVREYVAVLRRAFPDLGADLCEEYTRTYEGAVFGDAPISLPQYSRFVQVVLAMVEVINDRSLQLLRGSTAGKRGKSGAYASRLETL